MKICYCPLLLPDAEKLLSKTDSKLSFSRHKFGLGLLEGIQENFNDDIKVMNIINTVNFPKYKQLFFRTENWSHNNSSEDLHIGYINLFVIKYITQYLNLKKQLKKWIKKNGNEEIIICVQDMYFPSLCAALSVSKKYKNVKSCLVTGDLTGKFGLSPNCSPLKNFLIQLKDKYVDKQVKRFDSFVFLTKHMADALQVSHKPFTVMEALFSSNATSLNPINNLEKDKKIVFYAGALREEYGIGHLLRAFSLIEDPSYRLYIAGGGPAVDMIKDYADKDSRINFLGFISPKEVEEYHNLATALINPRTSELEFVKYSFASKNMESLASGKPYIAHKLPCDPPEYENHIQYADDESDEALSRKIIEICELPKEERDKIARSAREFILNEKNPKAMCKRIIDMWKSII